MAGGGGCSENDGRLSGSALWADWQGSLRGLIRVLIVAAMRRDECRVWLLMNVDSGVVALFDTVVFR